MFKVRGRGNFFCDFQDVGRLKMELCGARGAVGMWGDLSRAKTGSCGCNTSSLQIVFFYRSFLTT